MHSPLVTLYFWAFLLAYGIVMYALAPRASTPGSFFQGTSDAGAPASGFQLTSSIFISWIFAKSVTNAANLGAQYGFVGGLAYACYWLSIPIAGFVIYRLRVRLGARSLVHFLIQKHGRAAAAAFALAILVRLYNEIWSNTTVVAGYFGAIDSWHYLAAAIAFTLATLAYSLKGGLRSSLVTDVFQTFLFATLLILMLSFVLPDGRELPELITSGHFSLGTGLDLLFVALLQALSYPFHDPVLTDRGFITSERVMLRAFMASGILGFIGILAFSLIGVQDYASGNPASSNVPLAVAERLGLILLLPTCLIMIVSAGSTVDSTFSALARYFSVELAWLTGGRFKLTTIRAGMTVMIAFALLGNLPLLAGADILLATTLSGTMIMGLAPVFLLERFVGNSPTSFHLSFWPGFIIGILLAAGLWPETLAIGGGQHASLLGANCYGLILCTLAYLAPAVFTLRTHKNRRRT